MSEYVRECKICGRTAERASGGPCYYWASEDLCSKCDATQKTVSALRGLLGTPAVCLELDPVAALVLLKTIQLACRHPGFQGPLRKTAELIGRRVQRGLAVTPELDELLEKDWHAERWIVP